MRSLPSVDDVLGAWRPLAQHLAQGAAIELPDTVAPTEYRRSPAAATVARLAQRSGLFHFHFERRHHQAHPEAWVPAHAPDLAAPPGWDDGILPERKYQSFRHDLLISSFHPHHRAKWSTHEHCHGLVGFGWHHEATPFFHATAGRLAELLPVTLWYFLDEAFLRRCPDHAAAGALFQVGCPRCEAAAAADPKDAAAAARVADGLRFLDAELAAIARSRRLGRPVPHRWATIDLCSDGIAYARAHGARLRSPMFQEFASRFFVEGGGWSSSLDRLEARVLEVARGLLGGPDPAPWAPTPEQGRARWIVQDLAFRVATVREETEGEAASALDEVLDGLASCVPATCGAGPLDLAHTLRTARAAYEAVFAEFELPDPEDVFALGYRAPACDAGVRELTEGLESSVPGLLDWLGEAREPLLQAFAAREDWERGHIASRFAAFVAQQHPGLVAELATWQASLATLPPRPVDLLEGPGDGDALVPHAVVRVFEHDVLDIAEGLHDGRLDLDWSDGPRLVSHDGPPPAPRRTGLLAARDDAGEIVLLDLDPLAAAALAADPVGGPATLEEDERRALAEQGLLVRHVLHELHGSPHT